VVIRKGCPQKKSAKIDPLPLSAFVHIDTTPSLPPPEDICSEDTKQVLGSIHPVFITM